MKICTEKLMNMFQITSVTISAINGNTFLPQIAQICTEKLMNKYNVISAFICDNLRANISHTDNPDCHIKNKYTMNKYKTISAIICGRIFLILITKIAM